MGIEKFSEKTGKLGWNFYKILYYASLAPSGHNSQPWFVKMTSAKEWIVGSDPNRWLPEVDGSNREAMLSIGAFVENLVQAASSFGYRVETKVIAQTSFDPDIVKLNISKSKPLDISLEKIVARRTVKSNMLSKELTTSDVDDFSKSDDAKKYRDGLTTDGMEITGLAGWYVRHFMDKKDVMTKAFRDHPNSRFIVTRRVA